MKKETLAVHAGTYKDKATRGVNTPIFTSSAYEYIGRTSVPYPRYFNTPNHDVVKTKICALEGGADALVFASGMAAMSTSIFAHAGMGDHVVLMEESYGGTHALATGWLRRFGVDFSFASTDADAITGAARDRTRVIVVESPTNPLLSIVDIRKIAGFARKQGIVTIIDNTFASPVNQTPLDLGIDVVVHSGTKYLGGHSDICCGLAVGSPEIIQPIRSLARCLGGSLDSQSCYQLERSMKTLVLRVGQQTDNAGKVARFLDGNERVARVLYPGLETFPGHALAKGQMKGFGAMLSFELDGIDPDRFVERLALVSPAVSLGGVETTICSPALTSHSEMTKAERSKAGVTDSLLRLSVGVEHVEDIIADLDRAMRSF
ncbi:MAG: PLP-dependent aspartate aminotransferase family protein [Pseudomonadota bacterium]